MLIEGIKTLPLPRIAVFRNKVEEDYYEYCNAIATDETISKSDISKDCEHLDLNNIEQIITWINENGKKL